MALTGILTMAIPLLTKAAESLLKSKENKENKAFELERIRLEAGILADKEISQAQAEARKYEAQVEIERLKALSSINKAAGNSKGWANVSMNLVRALFGYSAVFIFIASAINLWKTGSPLLEQTEFAETFSGIIFYFFAERSVKKAFGKD